MGDGRTMGNVKKDALKKAIDGCICKVATVDEAFCDETELKSLGLDSLKMVELVVTLEEVLAIQFDDDVLDPSALRTVNDIYLLVEAHEKAETHETYEKGGSDDSH